MSDSSIVFEALVGNTAQVNGALPLTGRMLGLSSGGGIFTGHLPLSGKVAGSMPIPRISAFTAALPLTGAARGYTVAQGSFSTRLDLTGTAAPTALFRATLPLRGFAMSAGLPTSTARTGFMLLQPYLYGHAVPGIEVDYADTLALAGALTAQQVMVRKVLLSLAALCNGGLLDALSRVREQLSFKLTAAIVWNFLQTESLALGVSGTPSVRMITQVADALALAAGPGSELNAWNALSAALALGDAAGYVWPSQLLESLGLAASHGAALSAAVHASAMLDVSAGHAGGMTLTLLVADTLALDDAQAHGALLFHAINEGAVLLARMMLPDGEYVAWVCNTESRAFSSYRNFPFNSFCELQGRYYGATDEGIYELAGDDDDGTPIDARIRTGLLDLGTGLLKRHEAVYLGVAADGALVLKVVTVAPSGEKTESWYAVTAQQEGAPHEARVRVGKGLKSVYWSFELANVKGADFALDNLRLLPMILERRVP